MGTFLLGFAIGCVGLFFGWAPAVILTALVGGDPGCHH